MMEKTQRVAPLFSDSFIQILQERFDVTHNWPMNVLHLGRRQDSATSAERLLQHMPETVLQHVQGLKDYGLYFHERTLAEHWVASQSILRGLMDAYQSKWVMVLLDNHPTRGHLYRPEDILLSSSGWPEDSTGMQFTIPQEHPGRSKRFSDKEEFWQLMEEAGLQ